MVALRSVCALVLLVALSPTEALLPRALGARRAPIVRPGLRSRAVPARMTTADAGAPDRDAADAGGVDVAHVSRYGGATALEVGLIAATLAALDRVGFGRLPLACAVPLFAFLALRTRVFSVMDNSRPNRKAQGGAATPSETKRPSWTPPGIAFPIIWGTITLLRVASSTMVYAAKGRVLCTRPILALMVHLAVGDTWNSITNVERRLGVSFIAVFAVLASICWAVFEFSRVDRLAALILLPNAVWITIASVLTGAIWRLNTPLQPLLPMRNDGKKRA
ncbi:hypothetical protein KFE25_006853 [Diacronema lutheri]|uniref:Tryptophan-rich sensory protein n=2 Tax=Diacronema lutheri TaxID=2081491 RepID=A0A8J5XFC8_DIALT|nr:hypothetical protein KFE25_006853 [Diacronema lutheri]